MYKRRKFDENRGHLEKQGNNNFREIGGKCIEIAKIQGGIQNLEQMTKIEVMRNFGG